MRIRTEPATLVLVVSLATLACSEPDSSPATFRNPKNPAERRVNDLIRHMRFDEKLALIRGAANERLGIPAREPVEGAMGISATDNSGRPIQATAFPANIGMAATWNPGLAEQMGAVIAQQARSLGRGQVLGPLTDISHSPLNGRAFETYGEDPWLAARIVAAYIDGVQSEGEIATAIYPCAAAPPETESARETDLRPLEAAITEAGVWAIMPRDSIEATSFFATGLGFRGFTIIPFGADRLSEDSLDGEVRGILRAMFSSGAFDREPKRTTPIETPAHRAIARAAAAQSIVLLKNERGVLPLDQNKLRRIAVIGPNATVNRMAGGSYTVAARYSDPPLGALREIFGPRIVQAASPADAANADVAIVFAGTGVKTEAETVDRTSLDLPPGQNELIESVAKANRNTVVVLIAGFPVATEKWIDGVPAVLDAWFPGEEGGHAIADVLTGAINPSGRLPVTFPALFPFGWGLSYTQFGYSDLAILPTQVSPGQFVEVSLTVRNIGPRAGKETVQLYLRELQSASPPALRAFQQVDLDPGESKRVSFTLTGNALAHFDETRQDWVQNQAVFEVGLGSSSAEIRATGKFATIE